MSNPDNIELVRKVDQLGYLKVQISYLKAQISDLEKQAKALAGEVEAALLRGDDDFYDGQLFRAVLVRSERESVDWKAVAVRLELPAGARLHQGRVEPVRQDQRPQEGRGLNNTAPGTAPNGRQDHEQSKE